MDTSTDHTCTLGLIGAGAFGAFMLRHLAPHFDVAVTDPAQDTARLAAEHGARAADFAGCAACQIVVIATPVQTLSAVCADLAPLIRPGTLVADVASVKVRPARILAETLPDHADIVGTHPLFGPQSAPGPLTGMKIALCPVRGNRAAQVRDFLAGTLGLDVIETEPETHDRELAYVQGLTHLIGKTLLRLDLPAFRQTTVSYDLLRQAVGFIAQDSDDLFRAIEMENPYAAEAREAFFKAVREVETHLAPPTESKER